MSGRRSGADHRLSTGRRHLQVFVGRRAHRARHGRVSGLRRPQVHARRGSTPPRRTRSSARNFDSLFVRHWDTWRDHTRSNLFVAPVQLRRPRRHAGERQPRAARPTCLPSPMAATRNSPSPPDGSARGVQRARRGPRGTVVDEFRSVRVAVDGSAAPKNLTAGQSRLGHAAGVPEEWRSRLAGDEAARLRGRSIRASSCATRRHGARRRRAVGSLRHCISTWRATAARCWPPPATSARRRCSRSTRQRPRVAPVGRRHASPNFRRRRAAPWWSGTTSATPPDLYLVTRPRASAGG